MRRFGKDMATNLFPHSLSIMVTHAEGPAAAVAWKPWVLGFVRIRTRSRGNNGELAQKATVRDQPESLESLKPCTKSAISM